MLSVHVRSEEYLTVFPRKFYTLEISAIWYNTPYI